MLNHNIQNIIKEKYLQKCCKQNFNLCMEEIMELKHDFDYDYKYINCLNHIITIHKLKYIKTFHYDYFYDLYNKGLSVIGIKTCQELKYDNDTLIIERDEYHNGDKCINVDWYENGKTKILCRDTNYDKFNLFRNRILLMESLKDI